MFLDVLLKKQTIDTIHMLTREFNQQLIIIYTYGLKNVHNFKKTAPLASIKRQFLPCFTLMFGEKRNPADWTCLWWYNLIIHSQHQSFSSTNPSRSFVINNLNPGSKSKTHKSHSAVHRRTVAFRRKVGSFSAAHLAGPVWPSSTSPQWEIST